MALLPPDRERVAELIRTAFSDVPHPDQDDIALHDCEECAELRTSLAPHAWENLPGSVIEAHANSLPLLSPKAMVYYLPAYLLHALVHFHHASLPTEMTIYTFTPSAEYEEDEDRAEYQRDKLKYFTRAQIQAVNEFLLLVEGDESFRVYLGDVGAGRRRLLRFWEHRWAS